MTTKKLSCLLAVLQKYENDTICLDRASNRPGGSGSEPAGRQDWVVPYWHLLLQRLLRAPGRGSGVLERWKAMPSRLDVLQGLLRKVG